MQPSEFANLLPLKMKIDSYKLYTLYMEEVNRICDLKENEFKYTFQPKEIIDIIATIITNNPTLITWTK